MNEIPTPQDLQYEETGRTWPEIEKMTDAEFDQFHDYIMDEIYKRSGKSLAEWLDEGEFTST